MDANFPANGAFPVIRVELRKLEIEKEFKNLEACLSASAEQHNALLTNNSPAAPIFRSRSIERAAKRVLNTRFPKGIASCKSSMASFPCAGIATLPALLITRSRRAA
jgi:hypothetical protein